jgi:hypothetical protein
MNTLQQTANKASQADSISRRAFCKKHKNLAVLFHRFLRR